METVKEQGERWKAIAELFLKEDIQVYIKDASDNIYFGDILFVGEDSLTIQCFAPEQRKEKKFVLYWPLIVRFEKYEVEG